MLLNLYSSCSSVNTLIAAGTAGTSDPAVGKCWAKPSSFQWLGVLHLYSSKMLNTWVILSQDRLCAAVSVAALTNTFHTLQQCLYVHQLVFHKATVGVRTRRNPHTPLTSLSLTSCFPSTEEHSSGKTLTLAETTATSFSIKVPVLRHMISGFHASKLAPQMELRKHFCWLISKWLLSQSCNTLLLHLKKVLQTKKSNLTSPDKMTPKLSKTAN